MSKDVSQLAKMFGDLATGDAAPETGKYPHSVALGKLAGAMGRNAQAKRLSARRRAEIANKASKASWKIRKKTVPLV